MVSTNGQPVSKWWRMLPFILRRRKRDIHELDFWRLQSIFNNFRRILFLNNAILEDMAQLERVLGGEYIFDRAFLDNSVRSISSRVHHVTYNLNALTGNRHIPLYDRYQDIRTTLDDILSGNTRNLSPTPVLPLEDLSWEYEPQVGTSLVCLSELRRHPGIRIARGFIVTAEGTRAVNAAPSPGLEDGTDRFSRSAVLADIEERFSTLLASGCNAGFSVRVVHLERDEEQVGVQERHLLSVPAVNAATSAQVGWTENLLRLIREIDLRLEGKDGRQDSRFALFIRPVEPFAIRGTVLSRTSAGRRGGMQISAAPAEEGVAGDTFTLCRTFPFELINSSIAPRPAGYQYLRNRLATSESTQNPSLARGSALVPADIMKTLAETAITCERLIGGSVSLQWECSQDADCRITGLLPLNVRPEEVDQAALEMEREAAIILCRDGQMVQSGVAAGRIAHVSDATVPTAFPAGAIAVARYASPHLTPVLQRAGAIVTEYGTTMGHLATVARELRLPALFGVSGAMHLLPEGTEVTVDASDATVYSGILANLLRHGARQSDLSPADPEYRLLRRLLRFILPLNLIDPDAPEFTPAGCRSYHDIIHYSHEKAVDELAHFQEHRPELGSIRTRRMDLNVPIDLRILDIGGGLRPAAAAEPTIDDVLSPPFRTFLDGLRDPRAWNLELPSLGLRDILAGMTHEVSSLYDGRGALLENLAIVSDDYLNISLRVGYHFNVIDCHLGEDESRNHVYYRFAGGLADAERRGRRVRFISEVLAAMDFKVTIKGDLVIGRLKLVPAPAALSALSVLGALTTVAKQRDTCLYSDADTIALLNGFTEAFLSRKRDLITILAAGSPESSLQKGVL